MRERQLFKLISLIQFEHPQGFASRMCTGTHSCVGNNVSAICSVLLNTAARTSKLANLNFFFHWTFTGFPSDNIIYELSG